MGRILGAQNLLYTSFSKPEKNSPPCLVGREIETGESFVVLESLCDGVRALPGIVELQVYLFVNGKYRNIVFNSFLDLAPEHVFRERRYAPFNNTKIFFRGNRPSE